jgi:hypothetical protein
VKADIFYVAGFVQTRGALREALHIGFQKNEAMVGGLPGNSLVFVEFEEGGGVFEVAALALDAIGLEVAEHVQAFLELAGETLVVQAEGSDGAVGVDDVEVDGSLIGWWMSGAS